MTIKFLQFLHLVVFFCGSAFPYIMAERVSDDFLTYIPEWMIRRRLEEYASFAPETAPYFIASITIFPILFALFVAIAVKQIIVDGAILERVRNANIHPFVYVAGSFAPIYLLIFFPIYSDYIVGQGWFAFALTMPILPAYSAVSAWMAALFVTFWFYETKQA